MGRGEEPLQALLMVLSHSRKPAVVWSRGQDQLHWLAAHNGAYRRLAGVAAVNRIDNVSGSASRPNVAWFARIAARIGNCITHAVGESRGLCTIFALASRAECRARQSRRCAEKIGPALEPASSPQPDPGNPPLLPATPWTRRWPWIAVLGVALAARLAFALLTPREISWPDGREFVAVAESLLDRGSYGEQTLRPPGYPTLIAAIYAAWGRDLLWLRVTEAVLATVAVGMIGWIGARLFSPLAGWISAFLAALHPVMAFLPSTQYSESTLLLVLVGAFGAAFVAWRRGGAWRWALAGALFGAAALVRANSVLLLPGFGLLLWLARPDRRRGLARHGLVFLLALGAVIAPWLVRCRIEHGQWFFIATGGGRQFWIGNNPTATAATHESSWPDSAMMAEIIALPSEPQRERYFYRRGWEFVRGRPGDAFRLYWVKLGNLFALYPETYSRTRYLNRWSRLSQGAASAVVFAGALLALAQLRKHPALWPLIGAIASYGAATAVFFTVMRYRMAFEPCLLWMAGVGWARVVSRRDRVS